MPVTSLPLRVVAMIANPADAAAFDAEAEWQSLRDGTDALTRSGALELSRLESPTEVALQRSLRDAPWHVLHFIGHGGLHGGRYGSLVFEGREKRSRAVTAQHLGALLKQYEKLRLVVLQACREDRNVLAEIGTMLIEEGVPAVLSTPRCSVGPGMAGFYSALLAGEPLPDAAASIGADAQWALRSDLADGRIFPSPEEEIPTSPASKTPKARPVDSRKTAEESLERARKIAAAESERELERRRAAGQFDVFLCHNTSDKPAVKRIGRQLMERNILPWLDEWELQPGMAWQRVLEDQIGGIRAAAVFVGANGMGPWQRQELDTLLRQFVKRSCPVIPVLLPNAPTEPRLPLFLEGMTWVDFRMADPDPLDRFVWGITGKRGVLK
jgi:TIR domain-containing protein/CHAT domain-containing protein